MECGCIGKIGSSSFWIRGPLEVFKLIKKSRVLKKDLEKIFLDQIALKKITEFFLGQKVSEINSDFFLRSQSS